jgi:hypothetical protein
MREAMLFAAEGSFGVSAVLWDEFTLLYFFVEDVLREPALYR